MIWKNRTPRDKAISWQRFTAARGERYAACRLANYLNTPAIEARQRIIDRVDHLVHNKEFDNNILLIGSAGTGKDHLLTAIAFEAIKAGVERIEWQSGPAMFARIRAAIAARDEGDTVERFASPDVLCVSDVAWEGAELTKYEQQCFYRIVDRRYSMNRPIWITANVDTKSALDRLIGVHIVDRLCDAAIVLAFNWPSYRKIKEVIK